MNRIDGTQRLNDKFDVEYYFVVKDEKNDRLPFLMPDIDADERQYAEHRPPTGAAPLIFRNAWENESSAARMQEDIPDILFEGTTFLARDSICDRLLQLNLPQIYIHPAVYIDGKGGWHEDFWYVGISNFFDCWDRDKSRYGKKQLYIGDETLYDVYSYSLNSEKVEKTSLRDRL